MKRAALLAALLLAAPAAAQDAEEGRCGWCKTTGRLEVDVNRKFAAEKDSGPGWSVVHCSEALADENLALDWKPCERCKVPSLQGAAQAEWDAYAKAGKAWLEERRRVDRVVGVKDPLVHVQTTHFLIVWNVPKIVTAAKKGYNAHEAAHLYAGRLEALYARFQAMFGISDQQNLKSLHSFMIFESQAQAWKAGPVYTALQGLPTVKRAGGSQHDSVVVTWWDKSSYSKDQDMHRHQVHNLIHQLTATFYDIYWFQPGQFGLTPPWLHDKYGWLDEGLASWFEIDLDGKAETFCVREQDATARWGSADWRKNVYKAVAAGDIPPFAEVITKATDALSGKERQFAWSWCDYLMNRDVGEKTGAAAMGEAIKLCKHERPVRDVLRDAWGLTMLGFEEGWRAWVLETYSPTSKAR